MQAPQKDTGYEEVVADPGGWSAGERYWLILHHHRPVPRLAGGGRTLQVFGIEEEAAEFLPLQYAGEDWRVGAVDAGELLSILSGPSCAGVETVTLDPIPGVPDRMSDLLVGVGAGRFSWHLVRRLMGEVA